MTQTLRENDKAGPQPAPREYIVYKITNSINDKLYVGITCQSMGARWSKHISNANLNKQGGCRYLESSIRKYGSDNFKIDILEKVPNENIAKEREKYWIWKLGARNPAVGMNLTDGGDGTTGHIVSQSARARISEGNRGRKRSDWHRRIISQTHKGKPKTEEHKRKIGDAQRGPKNHMFGKHMTDGQKQAIRAANLGKTVSKETRDKKRKKAHENGADVYRTKNKLIKAQIVEIRAQHASGVFQAELARRYGVSIDTIYAIVHRRTWRDV